MTLANRQEFTEIFSVILSLESGPVVLNSKDIISCYFIEDIFSYSMTGKLIFHDMYGLIEHGPFTGNEQIIIAYGETDDRQVPFDIWKVSKIQQTNPTDPTAENLIELYFVDPTFELYTLKRYSRSYSDDKIITTIIKRILTKMIGLDSNNINMENSINSLNNFTIPYWTPMETIRWLMKRAEGDKSRTSGYLCYNNTSEGFATNVHTLNYLLDTENYVESEEYVFEDIRNKSNKILEWWVSGLDKSSTKFLRGGIWRGFDSETKSFIEKEYDYNDGITDTVLMGRKSLFSDISDTETVNILSGDSDTTTLGNIAYDGWSKRYNLQQVVNLVVRGREDRYAGQQIEVHWPSTARVQKFNKLLKGKYLVKSITHMFSGGSNMIYRQRMVLLKNAYSDIDMVSLLGGKKMNIYIEKKLWR